MKTITELGKVELSGKVVVSDPCYDRSTWCMALDIPVKPGRYDAVALISDEGDFGERVAALVLTLENDNETLNLSWEPINTTIGVDSGQCGIFDDSVYPQSKDGNPEFESFYNECCDITLSGNMAGILSSGNGVVSSSGFGDGGYDLHGKKNDDDRYVALMLDYDLVEKRKIMQALVTRAV